MINLIVLKIKIKKLIVNFINIKIFKTIVLILNIKVSLIRQMTKMIIANKMKLIKIDILNKLLTIKINKKYQKIKISLLYINYKQNNILKVSKYRDSLILGKIT